MSCSQQVMRKIDHLLEKKPSYIDFTLLPYMVVMILVNNWKFSLCLFYNKISHEIILDDHLVRKQAFQD